MGHPPRPSLTQRLGRLGAPIDGASIAVFRIAFGAILLVEVGRFFMHGWIAAYYIVPSFHFTYYGFGWVRPWPGPLMYVHFLLLGLAAAGVAVGVWYRVSAALLWVLFTYVFLLEEARYLNHFYAASLFAMLLSVIPAARVWSVDAWRQRASSTRGASSTGVASPSATNALPTWTLWLLRAQVAAIYVFGGIAKINPDWVRGEPMRSWLIERQDVPLIGLIVRNSLELYLFSYGGLLFDLLVVPAMLWRRTRPFAFAAAVAFHVINSQLFQIGIFPWMMLAATTLFFDPDWPRHMLARMARMARMPRMPRMRRLASIGRMEPFRAEPLPPVARTPLATGPTPVSWGLLTFLIAYIAVQIIVPLRHFVYPGNVSWTEEGHLFAWHMKLRDKAGSVRFMVTDRTTGESKVIEPRSELAGWQASKMAVRPDMILQFAHHLADERGGASRGIQVRVQSLVSLNNGAERPMIDPRADLAAEPRSVFPAWWIARGDDDNLEKAPTSAATPVTSRNSPVKNP